MANKQSCDNCRYMGISRFKFLDRDAPKPRDWDKIRRDGMRYGVPQRKWEGKWRSYKMPVCRRRAPVPAARTDDEYGPALPAMWPMVEADDWCGEFELAPDA